jgi:hypothetical protein
VLIDVVVPTERLLFRPISINDDLVVQTVFELVIRQHTSAAAIPRPGCHCATCAARKVGQSQDLMAADRNGRTVGNLYEKVIRNQADRVVTLPDADMQALERWKWPICRWPPRPRRRHSRSLVFPHPMAP